MATINSKGYGEIRSQAISNIVPKETLREVFKETLDTCADVLSHSYGPDGSTTEIRINMGKEDIGRSQYTKDGNNILTHILFNKPIELSVVDDLKSITREVVKEVGDGTTSAVILSDILFNKMIEKQKLAKENGIELSDKQMVQELNFFIEQIKEKIKSKGRECTLDDIYDIAYISSDGNEEIAKTIKSIYETSGMDCYIDVGANNTKDDVVKTYDGFTLDSGYFNPIFINNRLNTTCTIDKAKVYVFEDPIDTDDMLGFFSRIIGDNVIFPLKKAEEKYQKTHFLPDPKEFNIVPTVIVCPKIGADIRGAIDKTFATMSNFPDIYKQLLIVTNVMDLDKLYDLAAITGAKTIKKYIDPKVREADEKNGIAPTPNTVHWFAGGAEQVVADVASTKFINPAKMHNKDGSYSDTYTNLIKQLESKLKNYKEKNEDLKNIYILKRRIQSLKCNMVDYLVGGISYTDRDAKKDLVEDAVLNCRDAAIYGVGRAANFEALATIYEMIEDVYDEKINIVESEEDKTKAYIDMDGWYEKTTVGKNDFNPLIMLFEAYVQLYKKIYEVTVEYSDDALNIILKDSLTNKLPCDNRTGEYSNHVLSSIRSDIVIMNAVSKIVELMFTTNQYLLQSPNMNTYVF